MSFLSPRWCACLNEEFSLQAEKEAELGLPVQTPETVAEFKPQPQIFGFVWNLGPPKFNGLSWFSHLLKTNSGCTPHSLTRQSNIFGDAYHIPVASCFSSLEHMNTPFSTFSWSKEHFSQRNSVLLRFQGHIFYVQGAAKFCTQRRDIRWHLYSLKQGQLRHW